MKKIMTLGASLLLLAGCASNDGYTVKVNDANTTVVSGENVSITHQDLFTYLMDQNGANYVLNKALQTVANAFEIDEEALNTQLEQTINTYKSFIGEDLDTYTKENLGYDDFEAYKEAVLIPSIRQKLMIAQYSEDHFDTLAAQYHFKKLRMIVVEDQSTAMSLINQISDGEITFEEAVEQYSTDSSSKAKKGELGIVSDLSSTSTVDEAIISLLPQFTVEALYSVPVEVSNGYAVLEILETDVQVMKTDILEVLKNADTIIEEAEAYYLSENHFTVNDDRLKADIQSINKDYVK